MRYGYMGINGWWWLYDRKLHFTFGTGYKTKKEVLKVIEDLNKEENKNEKELKK